MDVNIIIRHVFERTFPRNILDSVTLVIISFNERITNLFYFFILLLLLLFVLFMLTLCWQSSNFLFTLDYFKWQGIDLETKQQFVTYSTLLIIMYFTTKNEPHFSLFFSYSLPLQYLKYVLKTKMREIGWIFFFFFLKLFTLGFCSCLMRCVVCVCECVNKFCIRVPMPSTIYYCLRRVSLCALIFRLLQMKNHKKRKFFDTIEIFVKIYSSTR